MQAFPRVEAGDVTRLCSHAIGVTLAAFLLAACAAPSRLSAQVNPPPTQGNNVQGGNVAGGIQIDAQGVVKPVFASSKAVALSKKRMEAAAAKLLPGDVNRPSVLRKVSLVRLEAACEEYAKKEQPVPLDMQFLAGVGRIDYLFFYPETKDIVIAGPAEGFAADAVGRVVGLTSGRPPLRLDDLVAALKALERDSKVGCSIDPDQRRLASLLGYIKKNTGPTTTRIAQARYQRMRDILGMQNVRVWGVEPESHYAGALVEADYRMKLIALGLERPPVRGLMSHLSMVGSGGNSMQRWWFTPLYDEFNVTEQHDAFQFAGQRAQLMSQEEQVGPQGQRSDAAFTRVSTQRFGKVFTARFPELAEKSAVFAELQNLIDLPVLAALLKKEHLPEQADWKMSLFLDRGQELVPKGNAPQEVPSAVNYRKARRGMIVGLIGGGVSIDASAAVRAIRFKTDPAARLDGIRRDSQLNDPPEQHPWWWD